MKNQLLEKIKLEEVKELENEIIKYQELFQNLQEEKNYQEEEFKLERIQ